MPSYKTIVRLLLPAVAFFLARAAGAVDFRFEPATVTAKPGDTISVQIIGTSAGDPFAGFGVAILKSPELTISNFSIPAVWTLKVNPATLTGERITFGGAVRASEQAPSDEAILASFKVRATTGGTFSLAFDMDHTGAGTAAGAALSAYPENEASVVFENPTLSVSPANQNVDAGQGTASLNVSDSGGGGIGWSANIGEGASWLSLSKDTGGTTPGTVQVAYAANPSLQQRTGTVIFTAPDAQGSPASATITQAGLTPQPVLSVTPLSVTVTSGQGTRTVSVSNSGTGTLQWSAEVVSGAEWLSITAGATGTVPGSVTLGYGQNTSGQSRTATLRITAAGAEGSPQDVSVTQEAGSQPVLSVNPASVTVTSEQGTRTVSVSNSGTGTLQWIAEVVSGAEWLSITTGTTGTAPGSVTLGHGQNTSGQSRTATLRITAAGAEGSPQDVSVTQEAGSKPVLSVTPLSVDLDVGAGSETVVVANIGTGTMQWSANVVEGAQWLMITSGAGGAAPGNIRVEYTANTSGATRSARLRVTAAEVEGSPQDVNFSQDVCVLAQAPSGFTATNGTSASGVILNWNAVPGVTGYEIYRSDTDVEITASILANTNSTTYVDVTAHSPESKYIPGCPGETQAVPHFHFYWIRALNDCGPGEFSASVSGSRGAAKSILIPEAFPASQNSDHERLLDANAPVFLRLHSLENILPDTISCTIQGDTQSNGVIEWIPISASDGWVKCTPLESWLPGNRMTFTAIAKTVYGGQAGAVIQTFLVSSELSAGKQGLDSALTEIIEEGVPQLQYSRGRPYLLSPDSVFDTPLTIQLPLPADCQTVPTLYYFDQESGLWYAGEDVQGWVVEQGVVKVLEGALYVSFVVQHGGIVQLGLPPEPSPIKAEMPLGCMFLFVILVAAFLAGRRQFLSKGAVLVIPLKLRI